MKKLFVVLLDPAFIDATNAGEPLHPGGGLSVPDVWESSVVEGRCIASLDPLTRLLLGRDRTEDRMLTRDLIDVGLIDATWPDRLPPVLGDRLREILATPDG